MIETSITIWNKRPAPLVLLSFLVRNRMVPGVKISSFNFLFFYFCSCSLTYRLDNVLSETSSIYYNLEI